MAGTEIDDVRARFGRAPHPEVTVWLCIAESWMAHFSTLGSAAYDKMHRALALSSALRLNRLQALSAAWLAHFDYSKFDMTAMAKHLSDALRVAGSSDHAAQARIGLVAASVYHSARRDDLATPWYSHARAHAFCDKDTATLGALTYNMTTIRAAHAFQDAIFGRDSVRLAKSAIIGAASSQGAVAIFGNISQTAFLPIVRAMLESAMGNYGVAIGLYESNLNVAAEQGIGYMRATHLADLAWCRWNVSDIRQARLDALAAASLIGPTMYVDDRAAAHGRLGQVFCCLGEYERSVAHTDAANSDWAECLEGHDKALRLMMDIFPFMVDRDEERGTDP